MVTIRVPGNNVCEREYVVEVIFHEFLGLAYKLELGSSDYEIILSNRKKLIIKDTFFNQYPEEKTYLKAENIPDRISEMDLFAAIFFMLTRWEECVNPVRDEHGRFPGRESLAYKEGFLRRPVVNEMIRELKQDLMRLDPALVFKERHFELILTHDVDHVRYWRGPFQLLRMMGGDILKRQNLPLAWNRLISYFGVKSGQTKDPYDRFDWVMGMSEKAGIQSRFYFMSGGTSPYDSCYSIEEQEDLIRHIRERGHLVGIHPSYNTFNNPKLFAKEKRRLENVCRCPIDEGRQHYLRFEVPTTWQIWESNEMAVDSTCGYADVEGFRCGTGDEFPVFNVWTRKKLRLRERPLLYMDDNAPKGCRIYDEETIEAKVFQIINACVAEKTKCTLLFHQSIFALEGIDYESIYEKIIDWYGAWKSQKSSHPNEVSEDQ